MAADLAFWRGEIERSRREQERYHGAWQTNLDYYTGRSPDAATAIQQGTDFVNVNVDFYQVEQKLAQLFYETPELQITGKGRLKGQSPILQSHRDLLNELLGPDYADVLPTIHKAIKDCLCTAGVGATKIGYQPSLREVEPPAQLGSVLGLTQAITLPVHEAWYWTRIPSKKFRAPADFHDTDFDRAPWLAHDFRMPLALARRDFQLPAEFTGTTTRDERILDDGSQAVAGTDLAYVEGTEVWYYAALFDEDVIHPLLMRRHVLITGVDGFVEKTPESPYQRVQPDGRLSADSMIGNPIHVLTLRDVPDSQHVPSDAQMTRPLVRELCKFRTQMVQERDANRPFVLYDIDALPPEILAKIENRTIGSLVGVEGGKLAAGVGSIMAAAVQGTAPRQTYLANDYITRDIEKSLGIDATGAGVTDHADESATKTAEVARSRNVRLDAERRRVLAWYLKGVAKFSALVCRYMTPQLSVPYLGEEGAAAWAQWDKQAVDGRLGFSAKPDSQIRLDAAHERKFALDLYQFTAKDPNVRRVELLRHLFEKAGLDPTTLVVDELPEQKPDPNIGFTFKGDDLIGPQAPIVLEILAQGGIQVSQPARDEAAGQLFKQMALGVRDASGKAVPATSRPQEHGGPADKVRPLSQQSADRTGNRPGPQPELAQ